MSSNCTYVLILSFGARSSARAYAREYMRGLPLPLNKGSAYRQRALVPQAYLRTVTSRVKYGRDHSRYALIISSYKKSARLKVYYFGLRIIGTGKTFRKAFPRPLGKYKHKISTKSKFRDIQSFYRKSMRDKQILYIRHRASATRTI